MRPQSFSLRRASVRIPAIFLAAGIAGILLSVASASATAQNGKPGDTEDNPITEIGGTSTTTVIFFKFPDGTSEVVATDRPATLATAAAVLKDLVAAEGRPPSHALLAQGADRRPASVKRRTQSWGTTACSGISSISKTGSTTVKGFVSHSCTTDVTWQGVTMYLYRSANMTLIAQGSKTQNGSSMSAATSNGTCLSSTWQYNLQMQFSAISNVNGGSNWQEWQGPVWISC